MKYEELQKILAESGKNYDLEMIEKAYRLAEASHEGQFRKTGEAYIEHPLAVAGILAELGMDSTCIAAAIMHDVVEDTDYTLEDLSKMGYPSEVIDVLRLLTHAPEVPYFDYVKAISVNPIAKQVKLADLAHNSDVTRLDEIDERAVTRTEKYKKAIVMLSE